MSRYHAPNRTRALAYWATPYHPSMPRIGAQGETPEEACRLAFLAAGINPNVGRECLVRPLVAEVAAIRNGLPLGANGHPAYSLTAPLAYEMSVEGWRATSLNGRA